MLARRLAASRRSAIISGAVRLAVPIMRDKLFFFVNYERQKYIIGAQSAATEPTDAWVNKAKTLLAAPQGSRQPDFAQPA